LKNQLHALKEADFKLQSSIIRINQQIDLLSRQIKEIENEIKFLIKSNEQLNEQIRLLTSIKGVGLITAATIIAEYEGFKDFSSISKAVSYAGLDIRLKQSGNYRGKSRITKQGNWRIRAVLFMAAMVVVQRKVEPFFSYYQQLAERKGNKMMALVGVERKILRICYALIKNKKPFDNDISKTENNIAA